MQDLFTILTAYLVMGRQKMEGTLNTLVTPAIFIQWVRGKGERSFHHNIYRDPEDNCALDEEDLTPEEKGHEYRYKFTPSTRVIIGMPWRVMDAETFHAVQALATLYAEYPYSVKTALSHEARKKVGAIWQTFSLSVEEFGLFQKYCKRVGWTLSKGLISVDAALDELNRLESRLRATIQRIRELRALAGPGEKRPDSLAKLLDELDNLTITLDTCTGEDYAKFTKLVATCHYGLSQVEFSRLTPVISRIVPLREIAYGLNIGQIATMLTDKYTHIPGGGTAVSTLDLGKELSLLKALFPILDILTYDAVNNELLIRLGGVSIRYNGTQTFLAGDLATLVNSTQVDAPTISSAERLAEIVARGVEE